MAGRLKPLMLRALGWLTYVQARACVRLWRLQRVPATAARLEASSRLLVVRLEETIGDTVMASTFLRELRAAAPQARIDLVVNEARTAMYEQCPYVDRIISTSLGSAADRRVLRRPLDARRLVRDHDLRGYDIAFVPRIDYDHHAAFIAAATKAPQRVGFSERSTERKAVVNRGLDLLLTNALVAAPHRHEVDRQLDLLRAVGANPMDTSTVMWLPDDAYQEGDRAITAAGLSGDFVVLAPTGGHSDLKQWPIDRYASLARTLLEHDLTPVFIGGPADRPLVDQLPDDVRDRSVDIVGTTSPLASAAILSRAAGFVGADSGMSHVAAALGVPTVAVFGPTCVHAFAPRGDFVRVLTKSLPCGPCATGDGVDRCSTCIFATPLCMHAVSAHVAWQALQGVVQEQRLRLAAGDSNASTL